MRYSYAGQQVALATQHGKQAAIAGPMLSVLGLQVVVAKGVDTDALGTFTGEVERSGSPIEVCTLKARLGMDATGLPVGLANEGSFGPHPQVPFIAAGFEIMTMIDDRSGITVTERSPVERTNYSSGRRCRSAQELQGWLTGVLFPSHALIVRPAVGEACVTKGVTTFSDLAAAVATAAAQSDDGHASVATDMRAHLNPTRMTSIGVLAQRLARRLDTACPACGIGGWGICGRIAGLPCQWCQTPTELTKFEILSCPRCKHQLQRPPLTGPQWADPGRCPDCNP